MIRIFISIFICLLFSAFNIVYARSSIHQIALDTSTIENTNHRKILVNDITNKLYLTDAKDLSMLHVLELESGDVISTISLAGSEGNSISTAINGNGKFFRAKNKIIVSAGKKLFIIDGKNNEIENNITFPGEVFSFAINQEKGTIWTTYIGPSATFGVVDNLSDSSLKTVVVKDKEGNVISPTKIYFYPKENQLILFDISSPSDIEKIFIVDAEENRLIDTITLKEPINATPDPASIAFNENTGILYVYGYDSGKIFIIDINKRELTGEITLTQLSIDGDLAESVGTIEVSPSINEIYATNSFENKLFIINGSTNGIVDISLLNEPVSIGVNTANNKVYIGGQQILPSRLTATVIDRPFIQVINRGIKADGHFTFVQMFNRSLKKMSRDLRKITMRPANKLDEVKEVVHKLNFVKNRIYKARTSSRKQCVKIINNLIEQFTPTTALINNLVGRLCKEFILTNVIPLGPCGDTININPEFEIIKSGLTIDLNQDKVPDLCAGKD